MGTPLKACPTMSQASVCDDIFEWSTQELDRIDPPVTVKVGSQPATSVRDAPVTDPSEDSEDVTPRTVDARDTDTVSWTSSSTHADDSQSPSNVPGADGRNGVKRKACSPARPVMRRRAHSFDAAETAAERVRVQQTRPVPVQLKSAAALQWRRGKAHASATCSALGRSGHGAPTSHKETPP